MDDLNLLNPERVLLSVMLDGDGWRGISPEEALSLCEWEDQAIVAGAAHGLQNHGLIQIEERENEYYYLEAEGEKAIAEGLLELRLWNWMVEQSPPTMANLQLYHEKYEVGPGLGLLKKLGVTIEGGVLKWEDTEKISEEIKLREWFLQTLDSIVNSEYDNNQSNPEEVFDPDRWSDMVEHFSTRKNFIRKVVRTERTYTLDEKAIDLDRSSLHVVNLVTDITPELLQSDAWKEAEFRAFDVTLDSSTPRTGRSHPMQALIERIRSVFLEMGFSELVDDYVQSAGWNMDALFIPQDHPAREMQDTFYLDEPATLPLPNDLMDTWKAIHEHGGETGSSGWGGSFSNETAQRPLLRTHTTVNTIQYLAQHPHDACRVFSVDRVFRKEAIDRTHLPEFHQIEGIIMEDGANLQMLVTTLKTFYAKMGLPEVRVRPAYFPYTEPSLEIEVKWRGKWLELGGAGIFRPEVTEPLGISSPVLAWGMGLERLAMLVLGLDDIRQLYISDLEWLRQQPIL